MSQTRCTVQTVPRTAPDIAALVLPVTTFADVAIVVPASYRASWSTCCTNLAAYPGPSWRADASVTRYTVHTRGPSGAGVAGAFVHVYTTIWTGEAWRALASEPVDPVHAFTPVQARQWLAIVDVSTAIRTLETFATDASVIPIGGVHAGGSVLARIARARWRCYVACCSLPTWWTVTSESISAILASSTVATGTWFAVSGAKSASFALPSTPADAGEVCDTVHAGAVVAAG